MPSEHQSVNDPDEIDVRRRDYFCSLLNVVMDEGKAAKEKPLDEIINGFNM